MATPALLHRTLVVPVSHQCYKRNFLIDLFTYLLMNVYTGYNLAVKETIYIIYNKIH